MRSRTLWNWTCAAAVACVPLAAVGGGVAWADVPQSDRVVYARAGQTWTCPGLGTFAVAYFPYNEKQESTLWLGHDTSGGAIKVSLLTAHTRLEFHSGATGVTEVYEYTVDQGGNVPPKTGQGRYPCDVAGYADDPSTGDWERITGEAIIRVPDGQAGPSDQQGI